MRGLLAFAVLALAACGSEEERAQRSGLSIPLQTARESSSPLPAVSGSRDKSRPLVLIDPGHGGSDPGAVSPFGGRREKDLTLALAQATRDALAASGRVRVALTRDADTALSLPDRFTIGRRLGADLLISIHADAAQREGARGASIYTLSEVASDEEAAQLAARENGGVTAGAAILSDDAGVNRILADLALREAITKSAEFARLLHREAAPLVPFQQDFHRFASLVVLKAPDVPSVLFETGYLTNEEDAAFLHSAEGQKRIAEGMKRAVEIYFARQRLGRRG